MGLYQAFKTDNQKEVNGVPIEFSANEDGTLPTIFISRMGESNKAYMRAIEHVQKPYRRQIQLQTMDKDLNNRLFREVFAQHIVKGWQNVQDETGAVLEFSQANVIRVLTELPDLYDELFKQAGSLELFKADTAETDAKN